MQLMQHQLAGVQYILGKQRTLLADEMGTGKTITTLAAIKYLLYWRMVTAGIVAVPAFLLSNWKLEIEKYYGFSPTILKPGRKIKPNCIYLVSYDSLKNPKFFGEVFNAIGFKIILAADEVHFIKNPSAARSKALYSLPVTYTVGITGTPIENRLEDLFGVLHFLDANLTGSLEDWSDRFYITKPTQIRRGNRLVTFPTIVGYKNLDLLQRILSTVMIRRLASQCIDLPPKIVQYIPYTPDTALYKNFRLQLELDDNSKMVEVIRMQQILSGYHSESRQFFESQKFKLLRNYLSSIPGRVIVWFKYEKVLDNVFHHLLLGRKIYFWTGQNASWRDEELSDWKTDPNGILFATIKAGGTGLNMTEANYSVFYEVEWSVSANKQAEARVHRQGQNSKVHICYFFGEKTVEEALLKLLAQKKTITDMIVENQEIHHNEIYNYTLQLKE